MERRVVLLSRDEGLASTIGRLLANGDRVAHYRSAERVADWSTPEVAAVILDSQPNARRLSYKQVRDRYDGPLIMLLDKGERRPDLPPDGARQFLHRPFKAADLSSMLDAPAPQLGSLEAAIIGAWSRHATPEPAVPVVPARSARHAAWRPSLPHRARAWAATIVALMGLLVVLGLSDRGSCAPGCTRFGDAVAGAAETETPLTSAPATGPTGGGSGGGRPPGASAASSQPPTPTGGGSPVAVGIGGLTQSTSPITGADTTAPSSPAAVPGVPAAPGATQPPPTTTPPGTTPPTTGPSPTTGPPTTGPPTTTPPTTEPPTTGPPTTDPPTTDPPTTDPPTTDPPTTDPPTTAPPTTAPPTTDPPTTAPPTTAPPTTAPPTTAPPTTAPPTTAPPTTAPPTTVETTAPPRPDRTRVAHDPFRHPAPPGAISAPPERRFPPGRPGHGPGGLLRRERSDEA